MTPRNDTQCLGAGEVAAESSAICAIPADVAARIRLSTIVRNAQESCEFTRGFEKRALELRQPTTTGENARKPTKAEVNGRESERVGVMLGVLPSFAPVGYGLPTPSDSASYHDFGFAGAVIRLPLVASFQISMTLEMALDATASGGRIVEPLRGSRRGISR